MCTFKACSTTKYLQLRGDGNCWCGCAIKSIHVFRIHAPQFCTSAYLCYTGNVIQSSIGAKSGKGNSCRFYNFKSKCILLGGWPTVNGVHAYTLGQPTPSSLRVYNSALVYLLYFVIIIFVISVSLHVNSLYNKKMFTISLISWW